MANLYGLDMTGLVAKPPRQAPVGTAGGRDRVCHGTYRLLAGMADDDILFLCRIPTNARLTHIYMIWDDLGTTMTADLGLYEPQVAAGDTPVAVDDNLFLSAEALGTVQAIPVDALFDTLDQTTAGKRLWEMAALSEDPGGHFDLALTFDSVGTPTTGADIIWAVHYVRD